MDSEDEATSSTTTKASGRLDLDVPAVLSVLALVFSGMSLHIIPGGPFISILGNFLPCILGGTAIWRSLRLLRHSAVCYKIAGVLFLVLSMLGIGHAILDAVVFWNSPHARGTLIGW